jgi:Zn-dependent alcohol dehydrogenase
VEELPAARRVLFAARRAGAVLNVMQPAGGQSIAVYGVGGVGLAGLMAARIAGCDPIIAVDLLPSRLALARELGATHTVESRGAETLAEIRKITGGGTDFALETSAVPTVFRLAAMGCEVSAPASWSAALAPALRSTSRCRGCRVAGLCAA